MVDVASGSTRTLTQDRRGISQPRFSPSGDRLAFLSSVVPTAGQPARAHILSCRWVAATRAGSRVRRKGCSTCLVAGWPHDRVCDRGRAEKKTGPERFNDSFEVKTTTSSSSRAASDARVERARRRRRGKAADVRVVEPADLVSAGRAGVAAELGADGRSIALVRLATPHSGDSDRATIQILDVATGQMRGLTGRERLEGQPTFSPDGSQLAYWQPRDGDTGTRMRSTSPRRQEVLAGALPVSSIGTPPVRSGCRTGSRFSSAPTTRPAWPCGSSRSTARRAGSIWAPRARGPRSGLMSRSAGTARSPSPPPIRRGPPGGRHGVANRDAETSDQSMPSWRRCRSERRNLTWKSEIFRHNGTLTIRPTSQPAGIPARARIHGGPRSVAPDVWR